MSIRPYSDKSRFRLGENRKSTNQRRGSTAVETSLQERDRNLKGYTLSDPRYSRESTKVAKTGKWLDMAGGQLWSRMIPTFFPWQNAIHRYAYGPSPKLKVMNRWDKKKRGPVYEKSKPARAHDGKTLGDGDYLTVSINGAARDGTVCRLMYGYRAAWCQGCCASECPRGLVYFDTFVKQFEKQKNYEKCIKGGWFTKTLTFLNAFFNIRVRVGLTAKVNEQCPEKVRMKCPTVNETWMTENSDLEDVDFSPCISHKQLFFSKGFQADFAAIGKMYFARYGIYHMKTTPKFTPEQRWNFLLSTFGSCATSDRFTLPMAGNNVKRHWGSDGVAGCQGPCYGEVSPIKSPACEVTYNSLRIEKQFEHLSNALTFTIMGTAETGAPCALDAGITVAICEESCCCESGLLKYDIATVPLSVEGGCLTWFTRTSAFASHFLSIRVRAFYVTLMTQRCPHGNDECPKADSGGTRRLGSAAAQPAHNTELGAASQTLSSHRYQTPPEKILDPKNFHICK